MKMIILVDICKYIILCDGITLLKANRISKLECKRQIIKHL